MTPLTWRAGMVFLVAAMLLAACGGGAASPPGQETDGGSPAPEGSAPAGGDGGAAGEISMAVDGQITTLSNAVADVPTFEAAQFIYDTLYTYDETLSPLPSLVDDFCEISDDQLTYTCTLKEGLTFHNGDPVTADDVAYVYQIADSDNCRFNPAACTGPFLDTVTAIDERTVEFVLAEPNATWNTVFLPGIFVESRAVIESAYEEFAGQAAAVDPQAAADAQAALDAALEAEEPDTAACEAALADAEAILEQAGITLPDRATFNTLDPDPDAEGEAGEGDFDPCSYGDALATLLGQLVDAFESEGIDAVAAVFPLLSFNTQPVGTGPWMCEPGCFQPGESLTLTAFDDYHKGPPATETMVMPIITDEIAIANAQQAGDVDWHYSTPSDAWEALRENPDIKFAEYPDFGYFSLQYNLREGRLFADLGARKAVQYCIDKARTVEVATNGQGIAIEGDIPPASWAFNASLETVERDTAAAVGFLEEAGWTVPDDDGDGIADGPATRGDEVFSTQVYVRAGQPERIAFMQLLRDQVAECGIELEVVEGDFATVLLPLLTFPHIPPNSTEPFDAYFGGWDTGFDPDPFSIWHSSQCTTEENPELFNYVCFQNDRADELIEQGLLTSDQDERAAIYQEFEQIVYEEQPYLFAWSDIKREALNANVNSTSGELQLDSPQWHWRFETLAIE
jgi:ABC-type transport system substrate-binding protein